jgi:hypothetical protein
VIVAEAELKPMYTKKKSWELYIYSKAYWQSKKSKISPFTDVYLRDHGHYSVEENWTNFKSMQATGAD